MSDSEDEVVRAAAYYVVLSGAYIKAKLIKNKRRWWMNSFYKSRSRYNGSDMLVDLTKEPSGMFEGFCRMSKIDFEYLLGKIGPVICKQDTNMRKSLPIQERLAVALRFLATGDSYASLSFLFKISKQTVSRCVDEVCKALIAELQEEVKLPRNENDWLKVAEQFERQWNFPHCLGAIDGKHVAIQSPANSGSEFYNYKGVFSVVLLALVDAQYRFTFVDIGCQGRISDGGVYNNSKMFSMVKNKELNIPPNKRLPSTNQELPYVFIGDSAFALTQNMLKPYPGNLEKGSKERIFNYRLCRARRVVENVFGIMASVFRVFRKPMLLEPNKVINVTLTCVLLHNFMRKSPTSVTMYTPPGTFDAEIDGELHPGTWRNDLSGMSSFTAIKKTARRPGEIAKSIRASFADYFCTDGKLSWQDKYC